MQVNAGFYCEYLNVVSLIMGCRRHKQDIPFGMIVSCIIIVPSTLWLIFYNIKSIPKHFYDDFMLDNIHFLKI